MKRDVPGYVEKAVFRLRDKEDYIKTLCQLFPDTMRWISYYIDTCLDHMRAEENIKLAALDQKKREQGEEATQRIQEA
jgi:hypothetical protein